MDRAIVPLVLAAGAVWFLWTAREAVHGRFPTTREPDGLSLLIAAMLVLTAGLCLVGAVVVAWS